MMASNGSAASASQLINDSVREIYCQQSVNPAHDSSVEYSPHQYAIKAHIQYLSTGGEQLAVIFGMSYQMLSVPLTVAGQFVQH